MRGIYPRSRKGYGKIGFYVVCGIILLFLIFPIFIIYPLAFSSASYLAFPPPGLSLRWFREYFSRSDWTSATVLSFQVAAVCSAISTAIGTLASFTIVRGKFRGKDFLYALVLSPMVVPVIIVAISLFFFISSLRLIGNWIVLGCCQVVLAVPTTVVVVSSTLKGFDETLERAAMSLGANWFQTLRKVTLPIISPGILTAAVFAFLSSFDELLIAEYIGGVHAVTLPRRLWAGLRWEINPTIAAVAALLISLSLLLMAFIELARRRTERITGPGT
jgi:putative spermidine/putrescine transport system permease protein